MSLRVPAAIAVAIALIILPVIIVRAQAEGEAEAPAAGEAAEATEASEASGEEPEATTSEEAVVEEEVAPEEIAPAASESEAVEATANEPTGSEADQADGSATASEPVTPGEDDAAPAASSEAASTTTEFLTLDTASSTASSTEPVADPPAEEPKEEPFVLQPAVSLHVSGSSISTEIELENLTCKSCAKVLPEAQIKAYYTAWYPNDGPDLKEVGQHAAEQELTVSDVALWASRSMTWSAADIAPGRYYFVVVVDPEDAIGAYRMQRMEFAI